MILADVLGNRLRQQRQILANLRRHTLKPGTRLVREWRGVTHTVLVHADGVEWKGRRYQSLSMVAREITGAHWTGPRFFGLRSPRTASEIGDAES